MSGKIIKKTKEGIIINIILFDKLITFCESFVSQYNQIKARQDVRGIEAKRPANNEDLLAISETATITNAVIIVLIKRYTMYFK